MDRVKQESTSSVLTATDERKSSKSFSLLTVHEKIENLLRSGDLLLDQYKTNEAQVYFEKALELHDESLISSSEDDTLEYNHRSTYLRTMSSLADSLYIQDQVVQAKDIYLRALEHSERHLGSSDHPYVLNLKDRIVLCTAALKSQQQSSDMMSSEKVPSEPKQPNQMTTKELVTAVRAAGIEHLATGLSEKIEYIELLSKHVQNQTPSSPVPVKTTGTNRATISIASDDNEKISILLEMGFTIDQAEAALALRRSSSGQTSLQEAIDFLVTNCTGHGVKPELNEYNTSDVTVTRNRSNSSQSHSPESSDSNSSSSSSRSITNSSSSKTNSSGKTNSSSSSVNCSSLSSLSSQTLATSSPTVTDVLKYPVAHEYPSRYWPTSGMPVVVDAETAEWICLTRVLDALARLIVHGGTDDDFAAFLYRPGLLQVLTECLTE